MNWAILAWYVSLIVVLVIELTISGMTSVNVCMGYDTKFEIPSKHCWESAINCSTAQFSKNLLPFQQFWRSWGTQFKVHSLQCTSTWKVLHLHSVVLKTLNAGTPSKSMIKEFTEKSNRAALSSNYAHIRHQVRNGVKPEKAINGNIRLKIEKCVSIKCCTPNCKSFSTSKTRSRLSLKNYSIHSQSRCHGGYRIKRFSELLYGTICSKQLHAHRQFDKFVI